MIRIISVLPFLLAGLAAPALAADEEPADTTAPATQNVAAPETEATPPAPQAASDVELQENPPARYTVKRRDTLWDISAKFLKNPWKWPDVWGMNRDQVKNPHLIYPGDVIILDLSGRTPRLRLEGVSDGGMSRWYGSELQTTKLQPRMRAEALARMAIPTIPAKEINPFLVRPLVVDPSEVAGAPRIVATTDSRVVLSASDMAYATGLDRSKGAYWNLYRPGRIFLDPDTGETLGHEAIYLGDAEVGSFGEISTVNITHAIQEVSNGDRLTIMQPLQSMPYVPRAPERKVHGKVIAGGDNAVAEIAPLSVVVLNRGARDGLESGHVLGLFRSEGTVAIGGREVPLPEQQYGVLLVFRTFNKMSYGLVMNSRRQVHVGDIIKNP